MKKYYEEAKYSAAFDRCVDVMTRMIQKYGQQVLEEQETETLKTTECSHNHKQSKPVFDKAA